MATICPNPDFANKSCKGCPHFRLDKEEGRMACFADHDKNKSIIDVSNMSFSAFCDYLNGEGFDRFEVILDYEDMQVYRDLETKKYYYLEGGTNDASDFFEVEPIAILHYSIINDIRMKDGEELSRLFDCDLCGEYVYDDGIDYIWFKAVERN